MLSCKKILWLVFAIITALPSCMEQKILFSFKNDVTRNFFREIPGLGAVTYLGQPVTQKANNVEVYLSSFGEKFVEKDHLLEFTELNDSTEIPFTTYLGINGYSQELYILKYEFTYAITNKKTGKSFDAPAEAALFFSVKHNGRGNTIGITPCYFGTVNREDTLISFNIELELKKYKNHYYLKPLKKINKKNELLFMPADFPSNPKSPEDKFNIEKIVRIGPNSIGGYKPLVFNIQDIFHDPNTLQFHYYTTLHLTQ